MKNLILKLSNNSEFFNEKRFVFRGRGSEKPLRTIDSSKDANDMSRGEVKKAYEKITSKTYLREANRICRRSAQACDLLKERDKAIYNREKAFRAKGDYGEKEKLSAEDFKGNVEWMLQEIYQLWERHKINEYNKLSKRGQEKKNLSLVTGDESQAAKEALINVITKRQRGESKVAFNKRIKDLKDLAAKIHNFRIDDQDGKARKVLADFVFNLEKQYSRNHQLLAVLKPFADAKRELRRKAATAVAARERPKSR